MREWGSTHLALSASLVNLQRRLDMFLLLNNVLLSLLEVAQFRIILFKLEKKLYNFFFNKKYEKCGCEN